MCNILTETRAQDRVQTQIQAVTQLVKREPLT